MPIKFRCPNCEQFLGISRAKAGAVTDCPNCGRTIRVPQLDGTIAPLPKPTFNHGDSGLAKALDALASLGGTEASVVAEAEPPPAKAVAIALAPAPPVEVVAFAIESPTQPPLPGGAAAERVADPLRELANLQPSALKPASASEAAKRKRIIGRVALLLLGLLFGFALGRATAPGGPAPAMGPVVQNPPNNPGAAAQLAPPTVSPTTEGASDLKLAIEGRVTYVNASGETRPDSGARILAIPARRTGTTKLGTASFIAGSNAVDLRLAQASIRVLGGDYALAGADGHYEIRLPATGKYQLLIVSRYQGRDPLQTGDPAGVGVLKDWFEQPRSFFGQTQSIVTEVQFDGQNSSIRDQVFPKVE